MKLFGVCLVSSHNRDEIITSDEERSLIINTYKSGLSMKAVASELNLSEWHVRKVISKNGLSRTKSEAISAGKKAAKFNRKKTTFVNDSEVKESSRIMSVLAIFNRPIQSKS